MKKFVVSCHQQSWLESKLKEAGQRFISQDPRPMIQWDIMSGPKIRIGTSILYRFTYHVSIDMS